MIRSTAAIAPFSLLLRALAVTALTVGALTVSACSAVAPQQKSAKTFASGEKATVGPLTYSIIDTEITPELVDGDTHRTPQTRFVLIHITASSSSNADVPIPAMTLIDDKGNMYPELADGSGVTDWLGVTRKVGPGQTESGHVIFDAPAQHYRLRLTDPNDDNDIGIDIPLDFIHEQLRDTTTIPGAAPDSPAAPPTK